jgi:hypothetical protein
MRVWALASCGSLLALTACSSDQSAVPPAEGEQPQGDSAIQVDPQPKSEVPASAPLAGPETTTARPLLKQNAAAPGRTPFKSNGRLAATPNRQTSELLRARLDRIRTQRATSLESLPRPSDRSLSQPQTVGAGAPATAEGTATGTINTALAPPPGQAGAAARWISTSPQTVTALPSPGSPSPAISPRPGTIAPNPAVPPATGRPLAALDTPRTAAPDLISPSVANTGPLFTSTPSSSGAGSHQGRSAQRVAGAPSLTLAANPTSIGAEAVTDSLGQPELSVGHRSGVTIAAVERDSDDRATADATTAVDEIAAANEIATANEIAVADDSSTGDETAVASASLENPPTTILDTARLPSAGLHQQSGLGNRIQLTPAPATDQPRFSGTHLQSGLVPSARGTGIATPAVQADPLMVRGAGSGVAPAAPTGTTLTAPGPAASLPLHPPLHQGGDVSPGEPAIVARQTPTAAPAPSELPSEQPTANGNGPTAEIDLVARLAAFRDGGSQALVSSSTINKVLSQMGFSETLRLAPDGLVLSQAAAPTGGESGPEGPVHLSGGEDSSVSNLCVSQAVAVDLPHIVSAPTAAGAHRQTAGEEVYIPLTQTERPERQLTVLGKSKPCPTGTKPLAQRVPTPATAGTAVADSSGDAQTP